MPVVAKIDQLIKDNPGNRELVSELRNIRSGIVIPGKTGTTRTSAQELASVLDGMKASMADENNKFILGTMTEIKNDLRALIPGMQQADKVFADASKPINEMVVGQELQRALTSGIGKERAALFAEAVRKATAIPELRNRSGAARFGNIEDVLSPQNMASVHGVGGDLANNEAYARLARSGMQEASRLTGSLPATIPGNWLSRKVNVTNAILRRLEGSGSDAAMLKFAEVSQDPKLMAKVMKDATPFERNKLLDMFFRMQGGLLGQRSYGGDNPLAGGLFPSEGQ